MSMADMMLVNTVFGPWTQCLASFGGAMKSWQASSVEMAPRLR